MNVWPPVSAAERFDMNKDLFSAAVRGDKSKALIVVPRRNFSFSAHIVDTFRFENDEKQVASMW
jgi:hypothetical protein